jgi:hypothetical protein
VLPNIRPQPPLKSDPDPQRNAPRPRCQAGFRLSFASQSTKPRQGRNGCTKSNSTAFAWPPASIVASVRLLKRNGIDWSDKYPSAIAALKNINARTAYFDGELCGIDEFGSPSFARTQAASDSERGVHVAYYTFDLMHLDRRNLSLSRLIGRKTLLEPRSPRRPIYSSTATSLATARFSARTQENSASSPPHPRLPPTDPERRGLVPYRPAEGHVSRPKDVSRRRDWRSDRDRRPWRLRAFDGRRPQ